MRPDRKHDNSFVQYCNDVVIKHYKTVMGASLTGVHIWSDGCKAQFKLKKQHYWLTEGQARYGVTIEHSFFQSCNGKGQSDGLGAVVKSALRRAERDGNYMADSRDAFGWFVKNRGGEVRRRRRNIISIHKQHKRFLYYIWLNEIDRRHPVSFKGMEGDVSSNFNFVGAGQQGRIFARWLLPCSCLRCIRFDAGNCTRNAEAGDTNSDSQRVARESQRARRRCECCRWRRRC